MRQRSFRVAATAVFVFTTFTRASGADPIDEIPPVFPAEEKRSLAELKRDEATAAVRSGAQLYEAREYALALERLQTATASDPQNETALLFTGLAQARLDNPKKAAEAWGKLQEVTHDERLAENLGKMRTILLREASERAAREALAQERRLKSEATDPRTVAVATFRNVGTATYAALGKAFAAMLIDNLTGLPGIKVLERDQVQALEEEARLATSGLVEKSTAIRAGKLLRAGRVTAGSHADWTASPTHIKVDALLVDVDAGTTVAGAKSEALATEFYSLVPTIATTFAGALNRPVAQLPPQAQQKVKEQHTKSLDAALAFGKALDGLDHHDTKAALAACKEVEKTDPNFKLAKRTCAFVPLTWLSVEGVASAMETTALATAAAAGGTSYVVPVIVGALVAGGIAGGTYAAVSGGGDGNGGGGNNPQITGVADQNVQAGQTAAIDMTCQDPDGTSTTIVNVDPPPGSTFTQTSGNPSTGQYRQATNAGQAGQSFTTRFDCRDASNATTSAIATIRVSAPPTPTPAPPPQCLPLESDCTSGSQCCSGGCGLAFDQNDVCCVPLRGACNPINEGFDCCQPTEASVSCSGPSPRCCVSSGSCTVDADCCSDFCYFGSCFNGAAAAADIAPR